MTGATILRIRGLDVRRGDLVLARGVEGDVAAGTLVVVVGPNGTGKSTLLAQIAGALDVPTGSVTVDGRDIAALSPRERATTLTFIEQHWTTAFPFPVREVVSWGVRHHGDAAAVDRALEAVGMTHVAMRPVPALSGGERARVGLARAMAQACPFVLLDEPTSAVDDAGRQQVLQTLAWMRASGHALLVATHDPDLVALADDRIELGQSRSDTP